MATQLVQTLSLGTLLRKAPVWLWVGAAWLVGYPCWLAGWGDAGNVGSLPDALASTSRLCIEGAAFLWAAAADGLHPRIRRALRITGWTSLYTVVVYLLPLAFAPGGPSPLATAVLSLLTLLSYAGTLAALVIYPTTRIRDGERTAIVIDLVIMTVAAGSLSWLLVTAPTAARLAVATDYWWVLGFGLAQFSLLVGMNILIVRALVSPSRRAFWWFVCGQLGYVPAMVLDQFQWAGAVDPRWSPVASFVGVLPTLVAALAFRADARTSAPDSRGPTWLGDFNPLPLAAPVVLGGFLIADLVRGPSGNALPFALAVVTISLLMSLRLFLSARYAILRARAEADKERRQQGEKLQAVGRLAGGVAHEFNNLMARVVGHAELGEASVGPDHPALDNFAKVKVAALRAAELTRQLLAFSGQQRTHVAPVDAEASLRAVAQHAERSLPDGIVLNLQIGAGPCLVLADDTQLTAALDQLIENAVEAMPRGGRLDLAVARERLQEPLDTPLISVPPGPYVTITVGDSGVGIPAESLAMVCDPFYSTKPPHLAAGLGLASVHGIVASHSGGLLIESRLGEGTRVRLYLPSR